MAEKVLSIEIGPKLTKVAEVDRKDLGVIYGGFYFETPSEMISNGIVTSSDTCINAFKLSLEEGLKKNGIKTRKVVFAVQASSIGMREEILPKMKDNRIRDFIQTNTSQFFSSINPDEYKIIFRENGSTEDDRMRAQLFAVNKKIIEAYEKLSDECNLLLVDITLLENGFASVLTEYYPVGCTVNIDVESVCTYLTIIKNGEVMQQRVIPYGVEAAVTAIQEADLVAQGADFVTVLGQMHKVNCFAPSLDSVEEDGDSKEDVATEAVEQLIGNVSRFLDYYISQHSQDVIDRVIISGLGTYLEGFGNLLTNEIGRSTESAEVSLIPRIVNKNSVSDLAVFLSSIYAGSNKNGVGFESNQASSIDFGNLKKADDDFSTAKRFFIACVVIFALFIIVPLIVKFVYTNKENKLDDEIAQLQEAKDIYDKYMSVKTKYDDVIEVDDMTVVANDAFLQLISEMETNIPTEATVASINADSSAVTIEIQAPDKDVCANTIAAFRNIENLKDISVSEITEVTSDEGAGYYTFTIDGFYNTTTNSDDSSSATSTTSASGNTQ